MDEAINGFLDKIIDARKDLTISDNFRSALIDFSMKANNGNRFGISMQSKDTIRINIGNDNCVCDMILPLNIDKQCYYINISNDKKRYIECYYNQEALYVVALRALNENIF